METRETVAMAWVREDGGMDHSSSNSNATSSRKEGPSLDLLFYLQQKVHIRETLTDLTTTGWVLLYLLVNLSHSLQFSASSGLDYYDNLHNRSLTQSLPCCFILYTASKVFSLNADPMHCTSACQMSNTPNYLTNGLN